MVHLLWSIYYFCISLRFFTGSTPQVSWSRGCQFNVFKLIFGKMLTIFPLYSMSCVVSRSNVDSARTGQAKSCKALFLKSRCFERIITPSNQIWTLKLGIKKFTQHPLSHNPIKLSKAAVEPYFTTLSLVTLFLQSQTFWNLYIYDVWIKKKLNSWLVKVGIFWLFPE